MPKGRKPRQNYLIEAPDDGLFAQPIGPWAEDKYRRLGMYAEMFATGMKNAWDVRVYLDLFSGPGYSRLRETGRLVLGSPLIALSLPDRFDRYVFADANPDAIAALRQRATRLAPDADLRFLVGDANERIQQIAAALPVHGADGKVLSFCFLDPCKLNIHFETVRRLAADRPIDFLILLALYVDANRNIERYASDESEVINRLLGDSAWRPRWETARRAGKSVVEFLAEEYSARMSGLGYIPMALDRMVKVRTHDGRLPLYYLAFFSRDERGLQFWNEVLKYSDDQLSLI
jgi:three-Cys-motif partner protein